jgi:aquaporin Z
MNAPESGGAQALVTEFLGTFLFVTIGAGSVVVTNAQLAPLGVFGVVFAHGIAFAVVLAAFGGQYNPALTVSVLVGGRMRIGDAASRIAAQIVGAVAAGGIVLAMLGQTADRLAVGTPAPRADLAAWRAILVEGVFTFFIAMVYWATMTEGRERIAAGFVVGLTLLASMLLAAQLSGGALNPVRHLGPAVVAGSFRRWWVYWVGPLGGGVLAGLVYPLVFGERRLPWRLVPATEAEPREPARRGRGG